MTVIREVRSQGWRVRLDLARQVLRLEVPEVFVDPRSRSNHDDPPLLPLLPHQPVSPVSGAMLLLKAKQFDDGLYAAVELAAQQDFGRFPGKASLLRTLAATLATDPAGADPGAATLIHAACGLGGLGVEAPAGLQVAVHRAIEEFLSDELKSQPLGFYTWSNELKAIFCQDRLLQQPLEPHVAEALTQALDRTPGGRATLDACLRLAARLTNPPKPLDRRGAGKCPPLLPPSRSHEDSLIERLYEDRHIPNGFDLMTELIRAIRAGEINLEPSETSGWYDHQTWSLEPLLAPERMPERAHLELGRRYRRHLEDLFRWALALARETHVKQAKIAAAGCIGPRQPPIYVGPALTVEPLPSLYSRRAACYRFVRSVLEEAFGAEALSGLHRLSAQGPSEVNLASELNWMQKLFEGAAATASREVGQEMHPANEDYSDCFAQWRDRLAADPDLSCDARMMVPVFHDLERRKIKVWVFLGWQTTQVWVNYRNQPAVLAVEREKPQESPAGQPPQVLFQSAYYEFATPVLAEVYVTRLLNRDEFRQHCDRYRTRQAILANLQ